MMDGNEIIHLDTEGGPTFSDEEVCYITYFFTVSVFVLPPRIQLLCFWQGCFKTVNLTKLC